MKRKHYTASALVDCPFYSVHNKDYIVCEGKRMMRSEYPFKVCQTDYKHCPQYKFMMKYVYKAD